MWRNSSGVGACARRVVEAQLLGPHHRPRLTDALAHDDAQGVVQQVGGRVVAGGLVAADSVHHRLGALAGRDAALGEPSHDDLIVLELHHVFDLELAGIGVDPAGVGDLAAAFGVERRLAELERQTTVAQLGAGADGGEDLEPLVADERARQVGDLRRWNASTSPGPDSKSPPLGGRAGTAALLAHEMLEACLVDRHAVLGGDLARQVEREAVRVVQLEGDCGRQLRARVARSAQSFVENPRSLLERAPEAALLFPGHPFDLAPLRGEIGVRVAHELGRAATHGGQERLLQTDGNALLNGTADDAPQDVVAPLVARQNAVHDEEGHAAGVFGDRAQCARGGVAAAVDDAAQLLTELDERHEQIGLVDRDDALRDGGDALETHAGVDVALGQGAQAATLVHVVLREDEVPVLHEPVAVAARLAVWASAADLGPHVVVELRARPAGARGAGRPPEVVVASADARCFSSGMPSRCQMAIASSSAGTWSSPPNTLTQTRSRSRPSSSLNSSAQAIDSSLK